MGKGRSRGGMLGLLGTVILLYALYHLGVVYGLPALGIDADLPVINFEKDTK